MDRINEAVVRQLKRQKGGEEVVPLWDKLWKAYKQEGPQGVADFLSQLLNPPREHE
jgi:hypothetical protein